MAIEPVRVLVAGKIHAAGIDLLCRRPGFKIELVDSVSVDSYRPHLALANALLIRTQPLTASEIALAPNLQIVSRHGVGYDAVDVQKLTARRIPLTIVGDVNSRTVAEHTLMLMLAAARRTVIHHAAATSGNWNERNRFDSVELDNKILLLLGFGRIGRRVAELAKAFGMRVLAFDPYVTAEEMLKAGAQKTDSLDESLACADFLSVHVPGGGGSVIGSRELGLMKPSAVIVNAARGGVVDEMALDLALRQRRLWAAALDVLSAEPPPSEHPLINNPFVTVSPHNAGLTEECAMRMALAAAQNIVDHFDGRLNAGLVVNPEVMGRSASVAPGN